MQLFFMISPLMPAQFRFTRKFDEPRHVHEHSPANANESGFEATLLAAAKKPSPSVIGFWIENPGFA
jgi:hypothetical protein